MLRYAVMLLLVRIHALVGSAHQLVKIFPGAGVPGSAQRNAVVCFTGKAVAGFREHCLEPGLRHTRAQHDEFITAHAVDVRAGEAGAQYVCCLHDNGVAPAVAVAVVDLLEAVDVAEYRADGAGGNGTGQKTLVLQTVFQPGERVVTVLVFQTGLQAPARQFGTDKVGQRFQHACIVNAGGGICNAQQAAAERVRQRRK